MGGANLEVFKFGLYMFFPIAIMFKFGDPDWYRLHVEPLKEIFYPAKASIKPPRTHAELQEEMEKMRTETAEKLARRRAERAQAENSSILSEAQAFSSDERHTEGQPKSPDWGQPSGRMV